MNVCCNGCSKDFVPYKHEDMICPFCLEEDFDRIGLALHLRGWCDKFPSTEEIQEEFNRNKENVKK